MAEHQNSSESGGKKNSSRHEYHGRSNEVAYTRLSHLGMLPQILLNSKDQLNLEKDQIAQLDNLKLECEVAMIKDISELRILELQIQNTVYQNKVDTENLDQKTNELAEKYRNFIRDLTSVNVKAKAILSETQLGSFNELVFQHEKRHHKH